MEFHEDVEQLYTCGICESTLGDDLRSHPCLKGYDDNHIIFYENLYLFPVVDDGTVICQSGLDDGREGLVRDERPSGSGIGKENICPKKKSSKTSLSKPVEPARRNSKLSDTEIELLILEVQRRIPLWDITIPIDRRSRETVSKQWEEVSDALNGKVSADDAKKKFKSLRDIHRKIIQAEQHPSGSRCSTPRERWKFYRQMEFLRDSCLLRPTTSNVNEAAHLDENTEPIDDESSQPSDLPPAKRSNKQSEKDESLLVLNRIADAMSREEPVPVAPPSPQMDDVEGFLMGIGTYLRRLPPGPRMTTIIEILKIVQQQHSRYCDE